MLDMFDKEIERLRSLEAPNFDKSFGAFFIVAIIGIVFFGYSGGSAKRYEMEGEITNISWKCTARDIPTITYKDINGELKAVCYDSIVLTRKDIKVGDYIVKKKGSSKAMVNGKEVQFSYERGLNN